MIKWNDIGVPDTQIFAFDDDFKGMILMQQLILKFQTDRCTVLIQKNFLFQANNFPNYNCNNFDNLTEFNSRLNHDINDETYVT